LTVDSDRGQANDPPRREQSNEVANPGRADQEVLHRRGPDLVTVRDFMSTEKTRKSEQPECAGKASPASAVAGQDIFDVRKIRRLVELMKEHDLSQIDLRQGDTRIQLQRGGAQVDQAVRVVGPIAPPVAAALPAPVAAAPAEEHLVLVKSPMVGTFYAAPDPDSPPYVKVGDHVGVDTTVCIVEAMKVFNEIPAEVSGKVVAVLAENGEPVEFGHPLFKVDTRG
jgi:acetyl-CoA carboxylase biotin carboxyl carrier protein